MSRIDRYYMMIISKYFQTPMDYYNLMMICKKYQEIPEMYHYNPIPMNEKVKKLFPNIETQYLYSSNEKRDLDFNLYKYCYSIKYSQYLQMRRPAYSFIKITCAKQDKKVIKQFPKEATHFGNGFFSNYQNQWNINLDDPDLFKNVISFGGACFSGNNYITSIHLDRVREIPSQCFMNCVNLKEIDLSNVRIIGSDCFKGCTSLTAITLPLFLISGAKMCFAHLRNLINIKTAGLTQLRNMIDYSTAKKFIENGIECKGFVLTPECISTIGFNIPDDPNLKVIKENCFYSQRFTNITIPTNITQLKKRAFANCLQLKEIDIRSVQTIGDECFKGCSSLTAITVGDLNSVGKYVFEGGSSIRKINLTTTMTMVKTNFFSSIKEIMSLDLSNVIKMESSCFFELTKVNFLKLSSKIDCDIDSCFSQDILICKMVFEGSNEFLHYVSPNIQIALNKLNVSAPFVRWGRVCDETNTNNGKLADNSFQVLLPKMPTRNYHSHSPSITIPTFITSIGNKCFNNKGNCYIIIPHTVKTIGEGCFCDCKNIKVHIHKGTKLGEGCFKNSKFSLVRYF